MTTYSLRETLEMICALGSEDKSAHGHAMSVKLASAALIGVSPELPEGDWSLIERNWPKGKPFRFIGKVRTKLKKKRRAAEMEGRAT